MMSPRRTSPPLGVDSSEDGRDRGWAPDADLEMGQLLGCGVLLGDAQADAGRLGAGLTLTHPHLDLRSVRGSAIDLMVRRVFGLGAGSPCGVDWQASPPLSSRAARRSAR